MTTAPISNAAAKNNVPAKQKVELGKISRRLLNITEYTTQGTGQNKIQRLGQNKAVVIAGAEIIPRSVYDLITINDNTQRLKHTTANASVKSHVNVFMVRSRLTTKAEPPPTRGVNRDSGTASANGGWVSCWELHSEL